MSVCYVTDYIQNFAANLRRKMPLSIHTSGEPPVGSKSHQDSKWGHSKAIHYYTNWLPPCKSWPPLTLLKSYQPNLTQFKWLPTANFHEVHLTYLDTLKAKKKVSLEGGGENQIAQVKRPISDLPDPHLTFTWPVPDLDMNLTIWVWTRADNHLISYRGIQWTQAF